MRTSATFPALRVLLATSLCALLPHVSRAATFTNNASLKADSGTNLTFASGSFTIACWARISIPSTISVSDNMIILMDRTDGDESQTFSYQLRFNGASGDVEFAMRGASGVFVKTLIQRPYLERWYHLAVVRSGGSLAYFVDGRLVQNTSENGTPSSSGTSGGGFAIGGINGSSRLFYGDIQEVAIHQSALTAPQIRAFMFADLPVTNFAGTLRGYYKLAHSTNSSDRYKNFALNPPASTDPLMKVGTGDIEFEPVDQAGEQSLFDSRKNGGRDAIAPLSGSFGWEQTALSRPTPGVAFDFRFSYSSANAASGARLGEFDPFEAPDLGHGWRHTFETRVLPEGGLSEIRVLSWDGSIETWLQATNDASGAVYRTRHKEYRGELRRLLSGELEWTTPERMLYHFRNPFPSEFDPPPDDPFLLKKGFLDEIRDFNSNSVRVSRDQLGKITYITDSAGGVFVFSYTNALVRAVTFGPWQVSFDYDQTNRLSTKSITNTSGLYTNVNTMWQFAYNATNGLLETIVDPRGNTDVFVQYDKYGRKTNEVDGLGRRTVTEYGVPGKRQIRHTDPGNFRWVETYDRKHRLLAQQDPLGNETRYSYDEAGNRTSITEPLGYRTLFAYDARANVIARTNELGEITRWGFHAFFNKATNEVNAEGWVNNYEYDASGNLQRHFDAIGDLVRYAYLSNGLVSTAIDANGNTNSFGYDTNGFVVRKTDAAGHSMRYGVNEVGWKLADTNALGEVTRYSYDINGNVMLTVDAFQRRFVKSYDANGNLIAASDGKGKPTQYSYDAANQKMLTIHRDNSVWSNSYTPRGEIARVTDPYTNHTANFYDAANRLVAVHDALGGSVTNTYDANGRVVEMIDKMGQRWSKTYDRLNRVVSETDPLGNTKATRYDVVGRIREIVTPNGFPSTHLYDGRGRLREWVDAENFRWQYQYDGVGNITNIIDALGGNYVMAYGPRNERTLERNQDNKSWRYVYDPLLRPQQQTDPNGLVRTVLYDQGGRIDYVTFSSGRTDDHQYDANNNLILLSRARPGQPPTSSFFAYDDMDRVREYTDAFTKRIGYAHDLRGRVASITYPDGRILTNRYDAINRLTNQVFQFDVSRQFSTSYAYDKADRLIWRSYPNGVAQTNSFDSAGRLTSLSHSPVAPPLTNGAINIALAYAYDRNGNKTSAMETGTFDWPLPALTDETANYTAAGRLRTRHIEQSAPGNNVQAITYNYDEAGNMTNAAGQGQSWSLTYDEDNRVTSLDWECLPLTSKQITNRYDALGRRIARRVDAIETRYVLDLSGSMERILCDTDASGSITAYYVHGHDLAFKVAQDGTLTCYHADAQANIIATTGSDQRVLQQYAYTPYGRSLGSTNCQPTSPDAQPYLFVGSQGVMEELPGLYFMRARYYSADAGVFLSTDPVKHIGPGWKPSFFGYAGGNPQTYFDPDGRIFRRAIAGAKSAIQKGKNVYSSVKTAVQSVASNPAVQATAKVVTASSKGGMKLGGPAGGLIAGAAGAALAYTSGYLRDTPSIMGTGNPLPATGSAGVFWPGIGNDHAAAHASSGIHYIINNPTHGRVLDIVESQFAKRLGPSTYEKQAAKMMDSMARTGGSFTFYAHSQGGQKLQQSADLMEERFATGSSVKYVNAYSTAEKATSAAMRVGLQSTWDCKTLDFVCHEQEAGPLEDFGYLGAWSIAEFGLGLNVHSPSSMLPR